MNANRTVSQRSALDAILSGRDVYIAGEGGVGKTSLLKEAIEALSIDKQVLAIAPTAMAAEAVGGSTLHSAFGLPARPLVHPADSERARGRLLFVDVVAIDEVGGVRRDGADCIAKAIDEASRDRAALGLGPIQVIAAGSFSLAPVATDKDKAVLSTFYGGESAGLYAFQSASLWDRFETHVLGVRFRQKDDPEFGEMLDRVRVGDEGSLPYFDALVDGRWPSDAIRITQTKRAADRANAKRLSRLRGKSRIYEGEADGKASIAHALAPKRLELKVGARVMALADGDGYHNGSIGTVVDLSGSSAWVKFGERGEPVEVRRHRWPAYEFQSMRDGNQDPEIVGAYSQLPLGLAYALTVHKARGMSLVSITVDPTPSRGGEITPGLLYAAMSRCRTSAGLHLTSSLSRAWIAPDPRVADFCASIGVPVPEPATGFERPMPRGTEGKSKGSFIAAATPPDAFGDRAKSPECMTLEEIQDELHEILRNRSRWARVYDLVDHVEKTAAYLEAGYRSFTAWVEAEASREGVSPSLLWHRRSAGRFYNAWAAGRSDPPGLGDLPQINENNLNLIRKISDKGGAPVDSLMNGLLKGELSSRDLKSMWGSVTAKRGGLDMDRVDKVNLLANRRAASLENGFLKIEIGGDKGLFNFIVDSLEDFFSQRPARPEALRDDGRPYGKERPFTAAK